MFAGSNSKLPWSHNLPHVNNANIIKFIDLLVNITYWFMGKWRGQAKYEIPLEGLFLCSYEVLNSFKITKVM